MIAPKRKIASVLLLWCASFVAIGADNNTWESGQTAFQQQNFSSALALFEKARDEGLTGPAVHYNIAVAQFKLRRYAAAGRTFAMIAREYPKMRGLAEYNLGLVSRRLDNVANARAHFLSAYELSPENREIRVLASKQLRELEPDITVTQWTGVIGFRGGYDDNIALRDVVALPIGITTESSSADFFASVQGPWNGGSGFRLEAATYVVKYLDADDFDQSEIRGVVFYDWRPNTWRVQIGISASAGSLGGDAFDRKAGVRAQARRKLGRNATFEFRYRYEDVTDADAIYAGIAGSRHQFRTRYRWFQSDHLLQLNYLLELNDRLDPGVSPTRNRVSFEYRFQPGAGIGYEAGIDLRRSEYDDLAAPRTEELLSLHGGVTYGFGNDWVGLVEIRTSENDSTDPAFNYDRMQYTLGAMKTF